MTRVPRCSVCGAEVAVDRTGAVMFHTVQVGKQVDVCEGSRARPLMLGLKPRMQRKAHQ